NAAALHALLATAHTDVAVALDNLGRPREALDAFHRGLEVLKPLVTANPTVIAYQKHQAETHRNIGNVLSRLGHTPEAIESFATARRLLEPLIAAQPTMTWHRYVLVNVEMNCARTLFDTGAPFDDVIAHLEAARDLA